MDINNMPLQISEVPEVDDNPYHPANDAYNKDVQHVQSIVMATQRMMKPKHVQIAKMHFAGRRGVDIAEEVNVTPNSVSTVLKRADVKKLLSLLIYIQAAMEGPSAAHRKAILYRIVVDNEKNSPKTALQAIAELNKMEMNNHLIETGQGPNQVSITINENYFPKTPLDQ